MIFPTKLSPHAAALFRTAKEKGWTALRFWIEFKQAVRLDKDPRNQGIPG